MTPEQMQMVRLSLAQATTNEHVLGQEFYQHLFGLAPDLHARFNGKIATESAKLRNVLQLTFGTLSDMPFLVATLQALARRDITRGLTEAHCRAIGMSLLWAIERRTGEAFTPRVMDAWIAFLAVVVSVLRPEIATPRTQAA